jgi:hypothetical protein
MRDGMLSSGGKVSFKYDPSNWGQERVKKLEAADCGEV